VRNRIRRQTKLTTVARDERLVPREERHGMLCRGCVECRLSRPLAPEDFRRETDDESNPEDQQMRDEDYEIIDSLTPEMLLAIDSAMIGFVSSRPRKAIAAYRLFVDHKHEVPFLAYWKDKGAMSDKSVERTRGI
jgi:hypothetical protein